MVERQSIFVSFTNDDRALLDELEIHLRPLESTFHVDHWPVRDDDIDEIDEALARASVAVVLLGSSLIGNDSMRRRQLPEILRRQANGDLFVVVVIVNEIDLDADLERLRDLALNTVEEPLAAMTGPQQTRMWVDVADRVQATAATATAGPMLARTDSLVDPRRLQPVESPLSREIPLIRRLVRSYGALVSRGLSGEDAVIGALSEASRAVIVTVIGDDSTAAAIDPIIALDAEAASIIQTARELVDTFLTSTSAAEGALRGLIHHGADGTHVLVIPLPGDSATFLVGAWSSEPPALTDATTSIFASAHLAASEAGYVSPERLEAAILDRLKRGYGFLPAELYERRRRLFSQRMTELTVHFQPIVHLSPTHPHISSWEALCRDEQTGTLPADVFSAAELWGHRFLGELDEIMLHVATTRYRDEHCAIGRTDPRLWPSLSVNVYPSSLSRTRYREAVRRVIDVLSIIPGPKLVLEISEKQDIDATHEFWDSDPMSTFRDTLLSYQRDFELDFAIDDFGAGFSSVARLAELEPRYVKVDRRVIGWDRAEIEIRYVTQRMQKPMVVAEGVEAGGRMSPLDLYDLGVKKIQGWIIAAAGKDLGLVERIAEASMGEISRALAATGHAETE